MSWLDPEEIERRRREVEAEKADQGREDTRPKYEWKTTLTRYDPHIRQILIDFAERYVGERIQKTWLETQNLGKGYALTGFEDQRGDHTAGYSYSWRLGSGMRFPCEARLGRPFGGEGCTAQFLSVTLSASVLEPHRFEIAGPAVVAPNEPGGIDIKQCPFSGSLETDLDEIKRAIVTMLAEGKLGPLVCAQGRWTFRYPTLMEDYAIFGIGPDGILDLGPAY